MAQDGVMPTKKVVPVVIYTSSLSGLERVLGQLRGFNRGWDYEVMSNWEHAQDMVREGSRVFVTGSVHGNVDLAVGVARGLKLGLEARGFQLRLVWLSSIKLEGDQRSMFDREVSIIDEAALRREVHRAVYTD